MSACCQCQAWQWELFGSNTNYCRWPRHLGSISLLSHAFRVGISQTGLLGTDTTSVPCLDQY